jgi:hypothetical protein
MWAPGCTNTLTSCRVSSDLCLTRAYLQRRGVHLWVDVHIYELHELYMQAAKHFFAKAVGHDTLLGASCIHPACV